MLPSSSRYTEQYTALPFRAQFSVPLSQDCRRVTISRSSKLDDAFERKTGVRQVHDRFRRQSLLSGDSDAQTYLESVKKLHRLLL
jgi:hypothetical protein